MHGEYRMHEKEKLYITCNFYITVDIWTKTKREDKTEFGMGYQIKWVFFWYFLMFLVFNNK